MFFFFKQKTAYEVRISDWSSDVCSSDLGVLFVEAVFAHPADSGGHLRRDLLGIADDDLVARGRGFAQGEADELVDLLEVRRRGHRAGKDQRERQPRVLFAQPDAEQVEDFIGGAAAAGEPDASVAEADEGFETLL